MKLVKTNTQRSRKLDINLLERKLIAIQEKYNLEDEQVEKILLLAR